MKRDWIWAWISGLPAVVITLVAFKSFGLFDQSPLLAVNLAFVSSAGIATAIVWQKNQRSIRRIKHSGGEIELIIRPIDALARTLILFPTLFGLYVLTRLLFIGPAIDWGITIASSAFMAYSLGLTQTAYKKRERRPSTEGS